MTVQDENAAAASTQWQTLETSHGPMRTYLVRPQGPVRAAVVVLQEAFGVNDHIQDVTRRVAAAGYLALAPDLFHRHSQGLVDYTDRETAMKRIAGLGIEEIHIDLQSVLRHLEQEKGLGQADVAVIGFCFGGRAAFTAATLFPDLAAAVVFYGPGIAAGEHAVLDKADGIGAKVLMIFGDEDPTIPLEHVNAIEDACRRANVSVQVEIFPTAGHAFHCDARPQAYHEASAKRAWNDTLDFLAGALPEART